MCPGSWRQQCTCELLSGTADLNLTFVIIWRVRRTKECFNSYQTLLPVQVGGVAGHETS